MTISEDEHKKFLDSIFKEIEQNEKVINKILSRKKNGKKEKSIQNKLIIFPTNLQHAGTTHTDVLKRIVLNINYYKDGINL